MRGYLVGLLAIAFAGAYPSKGLPQSEGVNEQAEYIIEDIQGSDVQVLEDGSQNWEKAQEGQEVESGDQVKTGDNSQANLMLESETTVHLDSNSTIKVDQVTSNENGGFLSRLDMLAGNLLADVKKNLQESNSTFEVDANGVVCGVRGTAFEVGFNGGEIQTSTHEGKVEVVDRDHQSHFVEAGNASTFNNGHFRLERRLERKEMDRFQQWRQYRKQIFVKRLRRLKDIVEHRRMMWKRHTPHPGNRPGVRFGREKRQLKRQRMERRNQP